MPYRLLLIAGLILMLSAQKITAQNQQVGFPRTTLTRGEVMEAIRSQTGYKFSYNSVAFDLTKQVKLSSTTLFVASAMEQMLENSGFDYVIQSEYIVIRQGNSQPTGKNIKSNGRQYVALTGDVYEPTRREDVVIAPRRRPLPAPVIEIASIPQITPDNAPTANDRNYSSHLVNVEDYLLKKRPAFALKTNILYGAGMLTPNIAFEIGLSERTSLEFSGSYNPWNLSGTHDSNKKLVHMILRPEFRYWICERFNGHFFGAHLFFARYNLGSHDIPLLFDRQYRYDGTAWGAGLTYGYHWAFAKRWGVEFNIGLGAAWMDYDKYECAVCNYDSKPEQKIYFGPTRAGVTLVFIIK